MENYSLFSAARINTPAVYEIRVAGWLDADWLEFFGKPAITLSGECDKEPQTILVICVSDQSALFGVLNALNQFRLPLLYVRFLGNASQPNPSDALESQRSPPTRQALSDESKINTQQ